MTKQANVSDDREAMTGPSASMPSDQLGLAPAIEALEQTTRALVAATQQILQLARGASAEIQPGIAQPPSEVPATVQLARINAWEDDPFSEAIATPNPALATPVVAHVPQNSNPKLQIRIAEPRPVPDRYAPGTAEFRYWTTAEALTRAINFWTPLLPVGTTWSSANPMPVTLVAGEDLNAFYARTNGLNFFHKRVKNVDVFSCESPEVACHELGHAVLDAVRPQLFNAASIEAAAFHESFGDMSGMLTALQLQSLRAKVLAETNGQLNVNSRLSRLAEQLGWAIRQLSPMAVDRDCLRNAANRFVYTPPALLPSSAPATRLSREVHSFSRVFTGAFLVALARMFKIQGGQGDAILLATSRDMGQLLVDGVLTAPIRPAYFSQVAAAMIQADRARFQGRYHSALASAFLERNILSAAATMGLAGAELPQAAPVQLGAPASAFDATPGSPIAYLYAGQEMGMAYRAGFGATPELARAEVRIGGKAISVHVAGEAARFNLAPDAFAGMVAADTDTSPDDAAHAFVHDLVSGGHVNFGGARGMFSELVSTESRKHTHLLAADPQGGAPVLKRQHFDCGLCCIR